MGIGIAVIIWLLFGIAAILIGRDRGHSAGSSFALGALLGPIGLLLVALVRPPMEGADGDTAAGFDANGDPVLPRA